MSAPAKPGRRGEWRALHASLLDEDAFLALSPVAKAVLLVVALRLPVCGIGRLSRIPLPLQVGCAVDDVDAALAELESAGLLRLGAGLAWRVAALRDAPGMTANNPNHRKRIAEELAELPPDAPLVREFCAAYPEWIAPADAPASADPASDPIAMPSKGHAHGIGMPCVTAPHQVDVDRDVDRNVDRDISQQPAEAASGAVKVRDGTAQALGPALLAELTTYADARGSPTSASALLAVCAAVLSASDPDERRTAAEVRDAVRDFLDKQAKPTPSALRAFLRGSRRIAPAAARGASLALSTVAAAGAAAAHKFGPPE